MRSTRRASALALVLGAVALGACTEPHTRPHRVGAGLPGPRRGGTFRYAWESDIATVDPVKKPAAAAAAPKNDFDKYFGEAAPAAKTPSDAA